MIKQLLEMNAEFDDQVEVLIDKAQEHKDYEQAITSINMKDGKALMKKILSGLTDEQTFVSAALSKLGA